MRKIPVHRREFGDRLRELRTAQAYSQEEFAHRVDLDRTYVSGCERGVRNPTLDVIIKLARGLDLPPAELLSTIKSAGSDY